MKNLKILNNENETLKERTKMKKFISSILVFTIMGLPVASSAFAAKGNQDDLVILYSQREEIKKEINKLDKELVNDMCIYGDAYDKDFYTKRGKDLQEELGNLNTLIDILEQEQQIEEDKSSLEEKEADVPANQQNDENKEESKKKTGMSTAKKVLITAGALAAIASAGYAAYIYCPAVKNLVDSNAIPFAKEIVNATKTKANGYYASAQNFMSDTATSAKNLGNALKTKANDYYALTKKFMNNKINSLTNTTSKHYESAKKLMSGVATSTKNLGNTIVTKASAYCASTKNFINCKAIPIVKNLSANVAKSLLIRGIVNKISGKLNSAKNTNSTALQVFEQTANNPLNVPMLGA